MGRQLQPGGYGLVCGGFPSLMTGGELLVGYRKPGLGGHGEGLRRSRGEAAGAKPGDTPVPSTENQRTWEPPALAPRCPRCQRRMAGIGAMPAEGHGWDGAAVALPAGESPVPGEGLLRWRPRPYSPPSFLLNWWGLVRAGAAASGSTISAFVAQQIPGAGSQKAARQVHGGAVEPNSSSTGTPPPTCRSSTPFWVPERRARTGPGGSGGP